MQNVLYNIYDCSSIFCRKKVQHLCSLTSKKKAGKVCKGKVCKAVPLHFQHTNTSIQCPNIVLLQENTLLLGMSIITKTLNMVLAINKHLKVVRDPDPLISIPPGW